MVLPEGVRDIVRRAGVSLFVLFGSRARAEASAGSDWDFGYRIAAGSKGFDPDALQAELVAALGTERIDLVDLDRASALLRFRVAVDGLPVYEGDTDAFQNFQIEAASFWCDVAPVLDASYTDVLASLGAT